MSESALALDSSAVISPCGLYRYWLERGPAGAPYAFWGLANPSKADATLDDPTVRKGRGFSTRLGFARFGFGNAFAGRSTDPKGLLQLADPIGPENFEWVRKTASGASIIIAAWGNAVHPRLRHRLPAFLELLRGCGTVYCLGYTADRQPRHPLMLAYDTPLEEYRP